jgi:hypothetical protein
MLKDVQLDARGDYFKTIDDRAAEVREIIHQFDDELKKTYMPIKAALSRKKQDMREQLREQIAQRKAAVKRARGEAGDDVDSAWADEWALDNQIENDLFMENGLTFEQTAREMGATPEQMGQLRELDNQVNTFLDDLYNIEKELSDRGLITNYSAMEEYLPFIYKRKSRVGGGANTERGAYVPGHAREQNVGLSRAADIETELMEKLYGLSGNDVQRFIWDANASNLNTNLDEVLMHRAVAHANVVKRGTLLGEFREFGVKIDDIANAVSDTSLAKYMQSPQNHEKLGLRTIDADPSLEGYLFDDEVTQIIDRVLEVANKDKNALVNGWMQYSQWWKAVATSTPGFHIRNFFSNNVTGYIKHGPKWFRPKEGFQAYVGVHAALAGEEATKRKFQKIMDVEGILNTPFAGKPLRHWVHEAQRKGVISKNTQGFDASETVEQLLQRDKGSWNPLNKEFKAFRVSHNVGAQIESTSRFQSFLLDLQQMAGKEEANEAMVELAKLNSKKWFLDYDDLSRFEKTKLKQVIPFYSWIRKNIANQLDAITTPEMWNNLASLPKLQTMGQEGEVDPTLIPDYMREGGYFKVNDAPNGDAVMWWPNIPIMDLNKIPLMFDADTGAPISSAGSLLTELADMSHPLIKTATELYTNKDTFRDMDIPYQDEAPRALGFIARHDNARKLMDGLMRFMGDEDGISAEIDEEGKVLLDGRAVRVIENLMPQLRVIDKMLDGPEELAKLGGFDLEQYISRAMGAEDKYEGLQEQLKTISWWLGVKSDTLDEENNRFWRAKDVYDEAKERQNVDRRQQPGAEFRTEQWKRRNTDLFRRFGIY